MLSYRDMSIRHKLQGIVIIACGVALLVASGAFTLYDRTTFLRTAQMSESCLHENFFWSGPFSSSLIEVQLNELGSIWDPKRPIFGLDSGRFAAQGQQNHRDLWSGRWESNPRPAFRKLLNVLT